MFNKIQGLPFGEPFFISFIIFLLICAPLYLNALSEKIPDLLPLQGSSHFTSLITLFAPNAIYNFSLENYKALGDPTTTYYFSGVIIFIALGIIGDKKMILSNNSFIAFMIIFLLSRNLFFINNIITDVNLNVNYGYYNYKIIINFKIKIP